MVSTVRRFVFRMILFLLVQCDCPEVLIAISLSVDYLAIVVNAFGCDIFEFWRVTEVSSHVDVDVVDDVLVVFD
jgi:hypothetical protein